MVDVVTLGSPVDVHPDLRLALAVLAATRGLNVTLPLRHIPGVLTVAKPEES